MTNAIFTAAVEGLGPERASALRSGFEWSRINEDGAIADRTNLLEIYKNNDSEGYSYRAGWLWGDSESVNTHPEPVEPNKFPAAFRFLFPRGWVDVLDNEHLPLPADLRQ